MMVKYLHVLYFLLASGDQLFSFLISETDWLLDASGFKATFEELKGNPKILRHDPLL